MAVMKYQTEVKKYMARRKAKMAALDWTAYILLLVGGLNWGLVGAFDFNLVEALFGSWDWLVRTVYIAVGVSAVYGLWTARKLVK